MLDMAAVSRKIDALYEQNKGIEAEALIKESIVQAVQTEDDNALLMLLNELIGYYRETSRVEESYQLADQAMALMDQMELGDSLPYATTLLNIANAYRAGGRLPDSLECYEKTMKIYDRLLPAEDMLIASLYNNQSLLFQEMDQFAQAKESLCKALNIVSKHQEAFFELAVTYTNLASTCLNLNQDEEASDYFQKAIEIFEAHSIEDAHYSAALSALGTYYYKREDYEQAAAYFRKAMEYMKRNLGENEYYYRLKENLEICEGKKSISGLSLCREYYETYGKPMIQEQFPDYVDKIAVGLAGEGSDCFGLDDEWSRDHDWGPDFCMWITQDTDREIGDRLREAYDRLPHEWKGYKRSVSPQGAGRRGVQTINGFFGRLLGTHDWEKEMNVPQDKPFWQNVSDASLAAAVNGEIYCDRQGIFSKVRNRLSEGYPKQIQFIRLAESGARFSQAGQYNYPRMLKRNDPVSAQMMLGDCLKEAAKLYYYMENQYPPHDKWLFKGLERFEDGKDFQKLMCENAIEDMAVMLIEKLYSKGFISDTDHYLDAHTPELLFKAEYASMCCKELVEIICKLEFEAFDKVQNVGGRASCQNDWPTFSIMRKSQYLTWNHEMLIQYIYDFKTEFLKGHNLIEEKYGRMMKSTAPDEYDRIKDHFAELSEQKASIIEAIVQMQVGWMEEFSEEYPVLAGNARSIHSVQDAPDNTSYETYLRGEISTYSDKMLELYGRYVVDYARRQKNLTKAIMKNSVELYGYQDLRSAEEQMSYYHFFGKH